MLVREHRNRESEKGRLSYAVMPCDSPVRLRKQRVCVWSCGKLARQLVLHVLTQHLLSAAVYHLRRLSDSPGIIGIHSL